MQPVIFLSGQEAASNTDILQGTRLQNVPSNGMLFFEFQASVADDGSNDHKVSIQLPNGATPLNGVLVPACTVATVGILDDRTFLKVGFPIAQGGHVVFSTALTGTSTLMWRIVFAV